MPKLPQFSTQLWDPTFHEAVAIQRDTRHSDYMNIDFGAAVQAGKSLFIWRQSGWMVIGPVGVITPGAIVHVTLYDNQTTLPVRIGRFTETHDKWGYPTTLGNFHPATPEEVLNATPTTASSQDRTATVALNPFLPQIVSSTDLAVLLNITREPQERAGLVANACAVTVGKDLYEFDLAQTTATRIVLAGHNAAVDFIPAGEICTRPTHRMVGELAGRAHWCPAQAWHCTNRQGNGGVKLDWSSVLIWDRHGVVREHNGTNPEAARELAEALWQDMVNQAEEEQLVDADRAWILTGRRVKNVLIGPTDTIRKGAVVTVLDRKTRKQLRVKITKSGSEETMHGSWYRTGLFVAYTEEMAANDKRPHRKVRSDLYGPGRVYKDEPECTYYDSDGSFQFATQIYDDSDY